MIFTVIYADLHMNVDFHQNFTKPIAMKKFTQKCSVLSNFFVSKPMKQG